MRIEYVAGVELRKYRKFFTNFDATVHFRFVKFYEKRF